MKIIQFEQSGLIIENNSGYKLAIDIGHYTPIEKLNGISVDVMLVSHIHKDHFSPEHIKKLSPKKLYLSRECIESLGEERLSSELIEVESGDSININGIKVLLFDVDHGPNVKVPLKANLGFLMEIDDKKIYYAGEMFNPSGIDVTSLEVDVAVIPVGGFYTFGPQEAVAFVKKFRKIGKIIPMHYQKTPETREDFIRLAVDSGFNTYSFCI
jgi:L-ascorbate metabolism protein UlaG (beta-lactamase superfamily)